MKHLSEIAILRTKNQKIGSNERLSVIDLVSWMGAMQAQDFTMAKLAIGIRIPGSTENEIERAVNQGEIIRTHILRPTWHFVAAKDIYWMLELTAPRIISSLKTRHKQLELSQAILSKSLNILEKKLKEGIHLTREELMKLFNYENIATNENRLSHLLEYAELNKLICSGPLKGKKQTYGLLDLRVPFKKHLNREESLAELAQRYFYSHGPATIHDFSWWSGLPIKDALQALGFVKHMLISETIESKEYWFTNLSFIKGNEEMNLHLLPAYDEFLISYKDRSPSVNLVKNKKVISSNGIFRPVVIMDGQVSGTWKYSSKEGQTLIEIELFKKGDSSKKRWIKDRAIKLALFNKTECEIRFGK